MAIEILLEGNLKPNSNPEAFTAFLQHFAHHKHIKFEDYGNVCVMEVCPEGIIECSYENDFVSILAQTNIAGPGFHAYASDILLAIKEESDVALEASDPTGYMQDHNFENLKYDYFYKWLSNIAEYVQEHDHLENLCISWPLHYYRPMAKEGHMITPMGYISIDAFVRDEIEELAEKFFIWNEEGMHAKYYLHCAMNLIWKECYFEYAAMNEYTQKTASSIMDYLEVAHELDATLPLPLTIYRQLASVLHREDLLTQASGFDDSNIGYRKQDIQYELKNWSIPVAGTCEIYQDQERGSAQIINGYHEEEEVWHWMLQIDVDKHKRYDSIFSQDSSFIIDQQNLHMPSYEGKMITMNYGEHYETFAQLRSQNEQLIVRYRTTEKEYLSKGEAIIKSIQHIHVENDDALKH